MSNSESRTANAVCRSLPDSPSRIRWCIHAPIRFSYSGLVEPRRIELPTFALRTRRSLHVDHPRLDFHVQLGVTNGKRGLPFAPGFAQPNPLVHPCTNSVFLLGFGGAEEDRTPDLRIANATLSRTELRPHVDHPKSDFLSNSESPTVNAICCWLPDSTARIRWCIHAPR